MSDQKVAVITGSSSGIGLLTAIEFAQNGYCVVATMRDLGRSGRLEEAAQKAGVREQTRPPPPRRHRVRFHPRRDRSHRARPRPHRRAGQQRRIQRRRICRRPVTRRNPPSVRNQLLRQRRHEQGRAAGHARAEVRTHHPSRLRRRARGTAHCSAPTAASKFALEGFSESLRIETHSLGIRVVLVEPGAFDTDIWTRNVIVAKGALDPNSPNKERSQRFTEVRQEGAPRTAATPAKWRDSSCASPTTPIPSSAT